MKTPGLILFLTLCAWCARGQSYSPTLAWNADPDPSIITNYTIYYGPAPGMYTNSVDAGTNLTATVSGLVRGQTYYFAATATDIWGLESDPSIEISYPPIVVAPPRNLRAAFMQ